MKIKAIVAAVLVSTASVALANGTAAPAAPQTPEAWLGRMSDFTQNTSAFKDPKVFVPWANAVTEPGFYSSMGPMMMDPANWTRMMGSAMDPNAFRNYAQFMDPNVSMKWMAAGMDPNFYTALMTQMSDPGKMMRWAMMPMDPKMWNMMMQGMNPNMYMKWMMAPMAPQSMQMMMAPMNPNMYTGWMGAAMDPKTYGSWGTWMAPMTAPTAGTAAPAGTYNFFDPNAWTQMMSAPFAMVPYGTAPAAQPAAPAAK